MHVLSSLTRRFGRGFGAVNLAQMRKFYQTWPKPEILQTASEKSGRPAPFPLSWSHYVKLLSVEKPQARVFYEAEALRGGWTVRQLDRQIGTQFYERTLLSRDKAAMLRKGQITKPEDALTPEDPRWREPPGGPHPLVEHGAGMAKYALEGLPNKVLAARYRTALPSEETLAAELQRTRKMLESRSAARSRKRKRRQ